MLRVVGGGDPISVRSGTGGPLQKVPLNHQIALEMRENTEEIIMQHFPQYYGNFAWWEAVMRF